MGIVDVSMSVVGTALVVGLAFMLARRRIHREYPCFFAYVLFAVLSSVVRLSVSQNYTLFFYAYWIGEIFYAVAALLALHEVFCEVFLSFYELWWWFRLVFPGAVALISAIVILGAIHHPALYGPRYLEVILALAKGVNYLQAVLFGLFFGLVLLLGIRWRSYPFGIVEGFGISALGALLGYGLRSEFGTKYNTLAKYAPPVAYLLGVLIWVDTFRRASEPEPDWQLTPQQMLEEARTHLKIVKRFFGRYSHV